MTAVAQLVNEQMFLIKQNIFLQQLGNYHYCLNYATYNKDLLNHTYLKYSVNIK